MSSWGHYKSVVLRIFCFCPQTVMYQNVCDSLLTLFMKWFTMHCCCLCTNTFLYRMWMLGYTYSTKNTAIYSPVWTPLVRFDNREHRQCVISSRHDGQNYVVFKLDSDLEGFDLGLNTTVIDDLRGQEMELNIRMRNARTTTNEPAALQMSRSTVTYSKTQACSYLDTLYALDRLCEMHTDNQR